MGYGARRRRRYVLWRPDRIRYFTFQKMSIMPMDPNCSCDVICAECQDEEIQASFYHDDDDWYDESTCCYDPSYRYGTYCHCAAQAKQEWLESKWWYRLWIWSLKMAHKPGMWYREWKRKRFVYNATCDECGHEWRHRGSEPPCPNCGHQGLPF